MNFEEWAKEVQKELPPVTTYDLTAEYNLLFPMDDGTDQMIDGIDLENDEDVANYLGVMLDD